MYYWSETSFIDHWVMISFIKTNSSTNCPVLVLLDISSSDKALPLNSDAESTCACVCFFMRVKRFVCRDGGDGEEGASLASGGPQSVTHWHLRSLQPPSLSHPFSSDRFVLLQCWHTRPDKPPQGFRGISIHLLPHLPLQQWWLSHSGEKRSEKDNWTESGMSWGGQRDRRAH